MQSKHQLAILYQLSVGVSRRGCFIMVSTYLGNQPPLCGRSVRSCKRIKERSFGGPLAGDLPISESAFNEPFRGMLRFQDHFNGIQLGLIERADHLVKTPFS
jgi:hypothetical protein